MENIKIGDYVTRNSYNNDILFEVMKINEDKVVLRGVELRLIADSSKEDLKVVKKNTINFQYDIKSISNNFNRGEYFYIPGKILHIDSDDNYLQQCVEYYKKNNVLAFGIKISEKDVESRVYEYLKEINPNILVITGHDSYSKKNSTYRNSKYYISSVKKARKYKKSNYDLVIIAGACQSDYKGLISAGATFASSPKKINIHALDPAIIATSISLIEKNELINPKELLSKTKYKEDGIGGIEINGTMEKGYPRNEEM